MRVINKDVSTILGCVDEHDDYKMAYLNCESCTSTATCDSCNNGFLSNGHCVNNCPI